MINLNRRKFIKQTAICAGGLPLGLNLRADNTHGLLKGVQSFLHIVANTDGTAGAAESGTVYCPRVTSEHNADTTDLTRFRDFHQWKDKQGNDLAIAVFQYLTGYETGFYHIECLRDGQDPFGEYNQNTEPLKLLNVYNGAYCATMHPCMEGVWQAMGFEQTRSVSIDRPSHCIVEIFYDGGWHLVDFDLRGILLKPDGVIASFEEIKKNPALSASPTKKIEPFFPGTQVAGLGQNYAKARVDYGFRWNQGSHTADFSLRPGESLTRWWDDQTGRWNHRPEYNQYDWMKKLWAQKPLGMKPNHRDFTRWNHGGGLFQYKPNLKSPSGDFAAGAMSSKGMENGPDGLKLSADSGEAVFSMFTPFPIVPIVNKMEDENDDELAAIVWLDPAVNVKLSISTDNGLSWQDAGEVQAINRPQLASGPKGCDLTKLVKGRYGYLLKLTVQGKVGETAIHSLKVDTWVQVAPISLPRLMKGTNKFRYDAGDHFDQPTVPMLVTPNCGDPEDLKKYVVEMPKDYDPKRNLMRIKGTVVLKCQAPAGQKIAWLSAGGTFNTIQGKGGPSTGNMMFYAVDKPEDFKQVYKANNPDWIDHWRYNYDTDIKLDKPAETVYVKYIGNPGVSVLRACLHLTPPRPADTLVKITHGYKLGGKDQEKTIELAKPGEYTIDCDGEVENVFIKIEKPSVGRL